ncbi:MAG: hypothetical protein N4A74_26190 [Carboxylicivirga sp.]|jgi:hypothetical protein|nr:hypothetical protein [Carboxylicivirga sp.]
MLVFITKGVSLYTLVVDNVSAASCKFIIDKKYLDTMDLKIALALILFILPTVWQSDLKGQMPKETERTIYLMRAKQFYGSGAKMNLMINGELFHKIKSGNRLIIKTSNQDTLNIQIVYPMMKKYKSKVLQITPESESEIYVDLFYWGEGYNPIKHAGTLNPAGSMPEFNIEIVEMNLTEGKVKFNQSENYKNNDKILIKHYRNHRITAHNNGS